MWYEAACVFVGAGFGALLRWGLSLRLNALFATIPLGTLSANLLGGYLVGAAVAIFTIKTGLPPHWRLFFITGFLGGLTTFSTFSAEVVRLLADMQFGWALVAAAAHLFGSLLLTALGMWSMRVWLGAA